MASPDKVFVKDLYTKLVSLPPERFEQTLLEIGVSLHEIPGVAVAQSARTQEAINWLARRGTLDHRTESIVDAASFEHRRAGSLRREAAEVLGLLNFDVAGLDVQGAPFRASQRLGVIQVEFLVDVWDSDLPVPATAVAEYHATMMTARARSPRLDGFYIARKIFDPRARELAEQYGIQVRTIRELHRDLLPLDAYAHRLMQAFEQDPLSRHFVPLMVAPPNARPSWSTDPSDVGFARPEILAPSVHRPRVSENPAVERLVSAWLKTEGKPAVQRAPVQSSAPSPRQRGRHHSDEVRDGFFPQRPAPATRSLAAELDEWLYASEVPCLLVFGDYGTGKTSSIRVFAAELAARYLADQGHARCPIVVPLKEFNMGLSEKALVAFLAQELRISHLSWQILETYFTQGRIVLLLDGGDIARVGDLLETAYGWYAFAAFVTDRLRTVGHEKRRQIYYLLSGVLTSRDGGSHTGLGPPFDRPLTKVYSGILACSFCSLPQSKVEKLIAGPNVFICNHCIVVATCRVWNFASDNEPSAAVETRDPSCNFCGKGRREVVCIIEDRELQTRICDECLALCCDILKDEAKTPEGFDTPSSE